MYESIELNLSDNQMKKLMNGESVLVKSSDVGKGTSVFVTSSQFNKLHNNPKSTKLKLSQAAIKYNMKHLVGNGLADDLLNLAKPAINLGRDAVQKELSNQAKKQLNNLTDMLSDKVPNGYVQDTIKFLGNQGANNVDAFLMKLLSDKNVNDSLNRLVGNGFFDSIINPVKSVVSGVASNAVPIATNLLTKSLENAINNKMTGKGPFSSVLSSFGLGYKPKKSNKYGLKYGKSKMTGKGPFDFVKNTLDTVSNFTPIGITRTNAINSFKDEMNKLQRGEIDLNSYLAMKSGKTTGGCSGCSGSGLYLP